MMNRFYSLNRSMSVRATDLFPYLLGFSKSCNIFPKESKAEKELTLENGYNETKDDFDLQYHAPILDYGEYKFKTRYLKTNAQKFHESNMKSKQS